MGHREQQASALDVLSAYEYALHPQDEHPLKHSDVDDLVACFNPANRHGRAASWAEGNPQSRWCSFTYDEPLQHDKVSLDISWLRDDNPGNSADLAEPDDIAAEINEHPRVALEEFEPMRTDISEAAQ